MAGLFLVLGFAVGMVAGVFAINHRNKKTGRDLDSKLAAFKVELGEAETEHRKQLKAIYNTELTLYRKALEDLKREMLMVETQRPPGGLLN